MKSTRSRNLAEATCRALEACSEEWVKRAGRGVRLEAKVEEDGEVSIAPGGLRFASTEAFQGAIDTGFALPRIVPLLLRPVDSIRAILTLRALARIFEDETDSEMKAALGLRGGLAAAEVLGLRDPKCREALQREKPGVVAFEVSGMNFGAWFGFGPNGSPKSGSGEPREEAAAKVCFRDSGVACRAVDGILDSLAAPALGEVEVTGRIPLAEVVGYVADLAASRLGFAR